MIERPSDVGGIGDIGPGLCWAPDGHSIYAIRTIDGVSNVWRLRLDGGQPRQVTGFAEERIFTFACSRDSADLAVVRGDIMTNVVLVTGVR